LSVSFVKKSQYLCIAYTSTGINCNL